ncbi:unnamed protein product [Arctogadus glacialis]
MENSSVIPTGAPQGLDFFMVLSCGEQRAIGVLGLLVGAVALLENGLVLGLIAGAPALRRRPSFLFMGSLALADLLASVVYPVSFVDFHLFRRHDGRAASLLKLGGVTLAFSGSVGSLLLTAVDRYLCLHRAHRYRALLTRRRALLALLLLWSATVLVSFLPLMGWQCATGAWPPCSELFPYVSLSFQLCWTAAIVLELLVILAAYATILWKARLHTAAMAALQAAAAGPQRARVRLDLRLARTLSLVLLVLVGCWLPVLGFMLADVAAALGLAQRRAFAFCSMLCLVNSAVNPLLYALRCQEIRRALVARLRCLTGGGACCRRRRAGTPTPRESGPTQPEVSGTGISSYGLATPWGSQREVDKGGQEEVDRGGQEEVGRGGQEEVGRGGQQEEVGRGGQEEVDRGGREEVDRGGGAGGGDGEGV